MRSPFRVQQVGCPGMERPIRFEHHRFLGDKRTPGRLRPRHLHRHRRDRRADGGGDVPLLRARHAPRGPQPRLPPRPRAPRAQRRRVAAHRGPPLPLQREPARPPTWPAPRCAPTSPRCPSVVLAHGYPSDVSATAVAASALPGAGRSARGGDGLAGHGAGLPGLRRLRGQLLARRLARRPPRRRRPPARQRGR